MKRKTVGLAGMALIMAVFVSLPGCADGASLGSPIQSVSTTGLSQAPAGTCSAWIQAQHSLDYDDHGCEEYADVLAYAESIGGGVIPVGDNRFFIIWFPDGWAELPDRKLVVTLHGSGGCAEKVFHWWTTLSAQRQYAIAALQCAEEDPPTGEVRLDSGFQVYDRPPARCVWIAASRFTTTCAPC